MLAAIADVRHERIGKSEQITISIQALNVDKTLWGDDADQFRYVHISDRVVHKLIVSLDAGRNDGLHRVPPRVRPSCQAFGVRN